MPEVCEEMSTKTLIFFVEKNTQGGWFKVNGKKWNIDAIEGDKED